MKRQKLHPDVWKELLEFLVGACPTKSGEKSVTFHQYHTDDFLFNAYKETVTTPVSFNTFLKLKEWLRVRKVKTYWGMFDCHQKSAQLPQRRVRAHASQLDMNNKSYYCISDQNNTGRGVPFYSWEALQPEWAASTDCGRSTSIGASAAG